MSQFDTLIVLAMAAGVVAGGLCVLSLVLMWIKSRFE